MQHSDHDIFSWFVIVLCQAELKAVIDNQEISTMVSTTELNITTGKV